MAATTSSSPSLTGTTHHEEERSEPSNAHLEDLSLITRRLYVSHFLSTWNSRVFEFGAVLYLAKIYPATLLPMSVYALARAASAILLSPVIGRYIDSADRLHVVRLSIVFQRIAVSLSCLVFLSLIVNWRWTQYLGSGNLVILAILACVEKLCSIMNLVSIEKDWVVVIAGENESNLTALNSQMRRIDLICKLAGPFAIAIIDGFSTQLAILINLGMNSGSIIIEYYTIAKVYNIVPALREPKMSPFNDVPPMDGPINERISHFWKCLIRGIHSTFHEFNVYFHHQAFRPSLSNSLLYFTVLSFAGQMVTYLLSAGYTSLHIAIARTLSVGFEISATWIAPLLMSHITPIRTGIWFINWQILCLAVGVTWFWTTLGSKPFLAASGIVAGTILSRVGLWGFDLSVQVNIQQAIESDIRGTFSAVEAALQNLFELFAFASTIIFSKPEQFRWPVMMSFVAVASSGVLYASFVRMRRGHLLHLPPCIVRNSKMNTRADGTGYELIVQSLDV
ncbi:iron-regulated transporter [Lentinula raphanica]|nr:iron-regulated transporter [Lentinula raphanica]